MVTTELKITKVTTDGEVKSCELYDPVVREFIAYFEESLVIYDGLQTIYLGRMSCYGTESPAQIRMPAGVLDAFTIKVSTNTLGSATTITARKNGGDTTMVISIPGSTTGRFRTSANPVTFADGDVLSFKADMGGIGTQDLVFKGESLEFLTKLE